jgi:hypothetical protein
LWSSSRWHVLQRSEIVQRHSVHLNRAVGSPQDRHADSLLGDGMRCSSHPSLGQRLVHYQMVSRPCIPRKSGPAAGGDGEDRHGAQSDPAALNFADHSREPAPVKLHFSCLHFSCSTIAPASLAHFKRPPTPRPKHSSPRPSPYCPVPPSGNSGRYR